MHYAPFFSPFENALCPFSHKNALCPFFPLSFLVVRQVPYSHEAVLGPADDATAV
jgi:hypothetical protein